MAQRQRLISRGVNRFRPAAMAANGTMEVCAANGSQAVPKSRRRLASIGYSASESYDRPGREENEGCNIPVANQMYQRPEGDPCQKWVTSDADDPLRRLLNAFFLRN